MPAPLGTKDRQQAAAEEDEAYDVQEPEQLIEIHGSLLSANAAAVLIEPGRAVTERLQTPLVNALSEGIAADDIVLATRVIQSLR